MSWCQEMSESRSPKSCQELSRTDWTWFSGMVIGHSSLILGCTLGAAWARLALEESRKVSWGEQSSILEFAGGCFRGAKDYSVEWLLVIQIGFWIDGGGEGVEPGKSDAVFMRTRSSNAHPMRKQCLGTALLERQTCSL